MGQQPGLGVDRGGMPDHADSDAEQYSKPEQYSNSDAHAAAEQHADEYTDRYPTQHAVPADDHPDDAADGDATADGDAATDANSGVLGSAGQHSGPPLARRPR